MSGPKTNITVNFSQGLDLKTDPYQVGAGKFLSLTNSVFDTLGRLTKRNGNVSLATLPEPASYLTTFNGNLTAIGSTLQAYNEGSKQWVAKGSVQPCTTKVLPIVRNSVNQTQCDSAVASNGLVCTAYSEYNGSSTSYKYVVNDSVTGQNIVAPTVLVGSSGSVTGNPRVFVLNELFVIVYTATISAQQHLQYIAVSSVNPSTSTAPQDIVSSYVSSTDLSWDGVVANQALFLAYNTTSGGQAINVTYLSNNQAAAGDTPEIPLVFPGSVATSVSLSADVMIPQSPIIYITFWDKVSSTGYTVSCDKNLNEIMTPTEWLASGTVNNVASAVDGGVLSIFYEVYNQYSFDSTLVSNYVSSVDVMAPAISGTGTVGSPFIVIRGVGLASKAFVVNGVIYFLSAYSSAFQPTYFLINGSLSTQSNPIVVSKLAYENGGGYLTMGLPAVTVTGNSAQFSYLFKDLIVADTSDLSPTNTNGASNIGVYQQTGINLATITFGTQGLDTAELGGNLNLTGGFLWNYDGQTACEQNFFLYPELDGRQNVGGGGGWSTLTTGGSMLAQQYFYVAVYEYIDNQGLSYKSAGSIPISVNLTTAGSSDNQVTVWIPTYRQTYKNVASTKITLYRWSQAQQNYFQTTSVEVPVLNNTTTDSVAIVDTNSDVTIQGNELLYTTGGVLENVNPPSSSIVTLFDNRIWLVNAEDPNTLWYSQSVVEGEPVQMSDLLTYYVAPGQGAQGSTGPITALAPMDDKLIIFKENAIYFINGTGPNALGVNSQYPPAPFFVTATVGCANQNSIVFTDNGLIFQSSKGQWLLSTGMQALYIGAPVEAYNGIEVAASSNIPGTNRVEFTLENGITTFYDYFPGTQQWGTFQGAPAVASTIYQNLPTHINAAGVAFQETPGEYLDLGVPVLMSFQSGWINLAGIHGYQRAYELRLLGTFLSPHKLIVSIAYDMSPTPLQQITINPNLYNLPWGGDTKWGQSSSWGTENSDFYGGNPSLEQFKIHLQKQTCQTIQISVQEVFDTTFGTIAGPGLTLSGFTIVAKVKKGYRPIGPARSVG